MELEEALAGKDHHTRDHVICHQHPRSIPTLRSADPTNQPTPCSWGVSVQCGMVVTLMRLQILWSEAIVHAYVPCILLGPSEMSKPNRTLFARTGFEGSFVLTRTHISSLCLQESRSLSDLHPPVLRSIS